MICPQCKEEMPLLSRICPVCGYVADEDENRLSATELADTLEEILLAARSLPAPSFSRSMGQLSVVMLPLLMLFLLLMALISEAGIFWIATILFALGSIAAIILKICGRIGNGRADRAFAELKNNFEFTARIARRDFGKSREVNNLLTEITERIREIEQERRSASRCNLMIWLAILLVGAILAGMGVRSVDKAVAVQEEIGWQKELDAFRAASVIDDYDIETRSALLAKILAAGETTAAEEFFRSYCMGRPGDYDCAVQIVDHYLQAGDREAAERFVGNCDLRYNSDRNKLKKRLTN